MEDLGVDGDKKKADLRKVEHVGVEWIHPAWVRDKWQAIANAVVSLRFTRNGHVLNS